MINFIDSTNWAYGSTEEWHMFWEFLWAFWFLFFPTVKTCHHRNPFEQNDFKLQRGNCKLLTTAFQACRGDGKSLIVKRTVDFRGLLKLSLLFLIKAKHIARKWMTSTKWNNVADKKMLEYYFIFTIWLQRNTVSCCVAVITVKCSTCPQLYSFVTIPVPVHHTGTGMLLFLEF